MFKAVNRALLVGLLGVVALGCAEDDDAGSGGTGGPATGMDSGTISGGVGGMGGSGGTSGEGGVGGSSGSGGEVIAGSGGVAGVTTGGAGGAGTGGVVDAGGASGSSGDGGSSGTGGTGGSDFDGGTCADDCPGVEWIAINGGTFQIGSTSGDPDEMPVHGVTVASFEIMKTEVTVMHYLACVNTGACSKPDGSTLSSYNFDENGEPRTGRENYPVNCIDWYQARTFCHWIGGRLPTEAEWEYAARNEGKDITYPWGNAAPSCTYAMVSVDFDSRGCGMGTTADVCSRPTGNTAQGLCDMAGNVNEWVDDDYHESYTGAPSNGDSWLDTPLSKKAVSRGGGFWLAVVFLRTASREDTYRTSQFFDHGVRCVR